MLMLLVPLGVVTSVTALGVTLGFAVGAVCLKVVDWTITGDGGAPLPGHLRTALLFSFSLLWAVSLSSAPTALGGIRLALFITLLASVALTDLKSMLIPDHLTIIGGLAGVALAGAAGGPGYLLAITGFVGALGVMYLVGLLGKLILRKEALGGGDVTLLAMIGAFLGPAGAAIALFAGAILALPYGIFLLIVRSETRLIPFGVFLGSGAVLALFFGEALLRGYSALVLGI